MNALVGWQSYYRAFLEESAGRVLISHRGPYVGDELGQAKLIDAMAAGRKAFLITAPPGCGKSRFALELARRLERAQRSWEVRFVCPDEPALRQELNALTRSGRLVLIVDGADDCLARVEELAALCAGAPPESPIHLVCLAQPEGRLPLTEVLASHLPAGEPLAMDLGRPGPKLVRELVDNLIPQLSPHHRDVIRRFAADSFFAPVLLSLSVARQKKLPQTLSTMNLRDYAIRQPIAQAVRDLCPAERALQALAVYAACAPVRPGDAAIRASAAAHACLSTSDVEALERCVQEAGLFRTDGSGWMRPVPDLLGDLILEETCFDEQGRPTRFGQSLMRALLEQRQYEAVSRNCAEIARLLSTPTRVDFLSELILERAAGLSAQTASEALYLLEGCSNFAARRPRTIVSLVEGLSRVLQAAPAVRELSRTDDLEVRALLLLARASEYDPSVVLHAMEYSRRLLVSARADAGSCRALHDHLTTFCRFAIARPLAHATAVLDVLKGWLESPDVATAALAASLAGGFLQLEMHSRLPKEDGLTAVSVGLDSTEEIRTLRDRALDILVRGARHAAAAVQCAAADSLRHWAHGYRGVARELREIWAPRLNQELNTLAESFSQLGSTTTHLPVRAAVELRGWRWRIDGDEPFIQRGGHRLLEALPETETYPLWKALHDAKLPVFSIPVDVSIEPADRCDRLLALTEPSEERKVELARDLFDRLDPQCSDSSAWSAVFTSVLSDLPTRPLQGRPHPYLAEFVRRHPAAAWSFVSEEAAQGPLRRILPALLGELRVQNPLRWREVIQGSAPGTRLFAVQLAALCTGGELDSIERATVSKGLELDDAESVHSSAQTLLSAPGPELAPGLTAVLAALPRRPADERLWELALDAFARWGDHVLLASEGEEIRPDIRTLSGELLRLLRTHGNSLSWKEGSHTRRLSTVIAIFAVAIPHTLRSRMLEPGPPSVDHSESALPLSTALMFEVARLVGRSPATSYWRKQFMAWMTEETDWAALGAGGLAGLCGLDDPCVPPLVTQIAQRPTSASLDALERFVGAHAGSPSFIEDALRLLLSQADTPEVYGLLEKTIISVIVRGRSDYAGAAPAGDRSAVLEAVDGSMRRGDLPPALRETLARASRAMQAAIEEDLLQGETH